MQLAKLEIADTPVVVPETVYDAAGVYVKAAVLSVVVYVRVIVLAIAMYVPDVAVAVQTTYQYYVPTLEVTEIYVNNNPPVQVVAGTVYMGEALATAPAGFTVAETPD